MVVNSHIIKTCLMAHYRFKRGFICCDEVVTDSGELADVVVDTGTSTIEIEVKTSKSDMKRDSFKKKHKKENKFRAVNRFYLCVPTELVEDGLDWIKETNPCYGLIEFRSETLKSGYRSWEKYIKTIKRAKNLCKSYKNRSHPISKRLCSALITQYQNIIKGYENVV